MRTSTAVYALLLLASLTAAIPARAQQPCLTGRVFDAATGTPVTARVTLYEHVLSWPVQGEFRICDVPVGEFRILATSSEHLPQFYREVDSCHLDCDRYSIWHQATIVRLSPGTETRLEFPLKRGGSVAGRVTSRQTGMPVSNATVTVSLVTGQGYVDVTSVPTDAHGAYAVPPVLWGGSQYKVRASGERHLTSIAGAPDCTVCSVFSEGSLITIVRGEQTHVDFSLRDRYGLLSGRVIDRFTRRPIADASVYVRQGVSGSETRTELNGRYSIEVERAPFKISAWADGYATQVHPCLYHCTIEDVPSTPFPQNGTPLIDFELSTIDLERVVPSWSDPVGGETARLYGIGLDDVAELRMDGVVIPFVAAHERFVEFIVPGHGDGVVTLSVRDVAGRTYELPDGFTYWSGAVPRRVRDIEDYAEADSRTPVDLVAFGGSLYFPSERGRDGLELWRYDGTPYVARMVKDISPFDTWGSDPSGLTVMGDSMYFVASGVTATSETVLWLTDGTEAGTKQVKSAAGRGLRSPRHLEAVGDQLYFLSYDADQVQWIWRVPKGSDQAHPILRLVDPTPSDQYDFAQIGSQVIFGAAGSSAGHELWITDGTLGGTKLLVDLLPSSGSSVPLEFTHFNGKVYFSATTNLGRELIVTNGTTAGTKTVAHLGPIYRGSFPVHLTPFNGSLYFEAYGTANAGIWKTDGTEAGTVYVGVGWGPLVPYKGYLYFMGYSGLVRLEGSRIVPIASIRDGGDLTLVSNRLWFSEAWDGPCDEYGCRRIGTSDGSAAGTRPLGTFPWRRPPVAFRGSSCFPSSLNSDGGLWCSDGTIEGTRLVWDYDENLRYIGSEPRFYVTRGNRAYITARTVKRGTELYATNLTEAGTQPLQRIYDRGGLAVGEVISTDRHDFFRGYSHISGNELWVTQGTPETTVQVTELGPEGDDGVFHLLFASEQHAWFTSTGRSYFEQSLWKSDGTGSGTVQVLPVVPSQLTLLGPDPVFAGVPGIHDCVVCLLDSSTGSISELWDPAEMHPYPAQVSGLQVVEDRLYVRVTNVPWFGSYLVSPGTRSTRLTSELADAVAALGERTVMVAADPYAWLGAALRVYASDGTGKPAVLIGTVSGLASQARWIFSSSTHVFVAAHRADDQWELWVTDGIDLRLVRTFRRPPGEGIGTPDGIAFFTAQEGWDREVWRSDGTAEGTRLAWDVSRVGSSNPGHYAIMGVYLLFSAESPNGDREPWMVQYKPEERKRAVSRRR